MGTRVGRSDHPHGPRTCPTGRTERTGQIVDNALERVEQARAALYKIVEACSGDLSHPAVIAASQHLDAEIVRYMRQQRSSHPKDPAAADSEEPYEPVKWWSLHNWIAQSSVARPQPFQRVVH
jgi:hypothetical protein